MGRANHALPHYPVWIPSDTPPRRKLTSWLRNMPLYCANFTTTPNSNTSSLPRRRSTKIDPNTEPALFWVADFVQNTYVNCIIPFLPAGASRKCKALANPWAHADPNYQWEWEWDTQAGILKDASGKPVEFPRLLQSQAKEKVSDVVTRGFMTKKIVLENETDVKARLLIGGKAFDFGEDIKNAVRNLD
ncbi:hypothetical protein DL771_003022 [Monosporascus sp. 5C6A]|nr:hypothetical protein DL771_003022 [Monosporascus sp. 5C6A]